MRPPSDILDKSDVVDIRHTTGMADTPDKRCMAGIRCRPPVSEQTGLVFERSNET